ncbi:MAG: hypothetical protein LUQ65_10305 [Candidatus Helarchaeota archaeon]|nr:hypothetical protein [Candidatus Helarchaeota archaeon]
MKKILLIVLAMAAIFCISISASAQTWFTADRLAIQWDTPTLMTDGTPIPAVDVIKYNIYIKDATNPLTLPELIASDLTVLTYTVQFPRQGRFFIGVTARRYVGGTDYAGESAGAWSNDPAFTGGNPFGGVYYYLTNPPSGLKKQ